MAATSYWTPLNNEDDDEDEDTKEINVIKKLPTTITKDRTNKWVRHTERRREHKLIINSGTTSHFVSKELNLPSEGTSNKSMYLPDDTKLQTSTKTKLPFEQLTNKAREVDVLPGLKRLLLSVSEMAEEGYATVFHPGDKGVTIHKEDMFTITTSKPPVPQGCKNNPAKLWTVSVPQSSNNDEVCNVYCLPSIQQSIKYLHAATRFPTRDEWLDAIKAGNYTTWPGLTTTAVRSLIVPFVCTVVIVHGSLPCELRALQRISSCTTRPLSSTL